MKGRILIVEDESSIRELFRRALERAGYSVATAPDAELALAGLGEIGPDIIITDVRMAGLSGLELLELVRTNSPDVDVIVMTGYEDMQTAVTAMRAGAYDYLVKPLDPGQVERVVERCFRDRAVRRRLQHLSESAAEPYELTRLVGRSPGMIEIYKLIGKLAGSSAPIFIRGETGTGKEVVARAIHFNSAHAEEPFVAVNCTAVPENLLESELFGHVRGAFTGAVQDRKGRFELAGSGTIFLDEIGETTNEFQAKLLRVLQEREFYPVGGERARTTQARVIAATHRAVEDLVRAGRFREDLYFRLKVVELVIPPLRERREDIPLLAQHLLGRACQAMHKQVPVIPPDVLRLLVDYHWPGNVRELENTLIRAAVLATGPSISAEHLALGGSAREMDSGFGGPAGGDGALADDSLAAAERAQIRRVLGKTGGNKRQAARLLQISRSRLDRLIKKYELS